MLKNMFLLCFGAYTFAHSPTRRAPRLPCRQVGFKHAMPMRATNIRNREMWHFLGVGTTDHLTIIARVNIDFKFPDPPAGKSSMH